MQILKTTLIEFDEKKERERLETNFKDDEVQPQLLALFDAFIAGDLATASKLGMELPKAAAEFLHMVVYGVIRDYIQQTSEKKAYNLGEGKGELPFDSLRDLEGGPTSVARFNYPRFTFRTRSLETDSPNNVNTQHAYCLQMLQATRQTLMKSTEELSRAAYSDGANVHGQVQENLEILEAAAGAAENDQGSLRDVGTHYEVVPREV